MTFVKFGNDRSCLSVSLTILLMTQRTKIDEHNGKLNFPS